MDVSAKSPVVGMMSLHPDIFASNPRLDFIQENRVWQEKIRMVVSMSIDQYFLFLLYF